jgi:cobalt-zinc-cadmium efflux system membrane fusion protein
MSPNPPKTDVSKASSPSLFWFIGGGAGFLLIAFAVLFNHPAKEAAQPVAEPKADKTGVTLKEGSPQWGYVELAVAEEGSGLPPLAVPARIGFDEKRTASIGTPLSGRVESVVARLGDKVKAGDNLFSVKSRDFADLDKEVSATRESVANKRRVRDRAKELLALNAVAEKDVLAAEADLKDAELAQKAAEAKQRSLSVASAGDNLFWVRAPRAGTVVSHDVFTGQEVTSDRAEPLMRISDMDAVMVVADVVELDSRDLQEGGTAVIRTRDGTVREGTIEHISSVVDPQRQTVGVRIKADNADHALKPNAFVDVTFKLGQANKRVLIDEEAVVSDGDRSAVFVVKGPDRLEKQEVMPGRRRDKRVEIRSGLAAGTRYVSRGALLLLNQVELAD